jgi:polyisoprenoid-binding protein YceI
MMTRCLLPILSIILLVGCGTPISPTPLPGTPTPQEEATLLTVWTDESTVAFTAQALGGNLQVDGTFDARSGSITLTPEAGELRIHVYLLIDASSVTAGNVMIDEALKLGMETASHPLATFEAQSTTLVPVTEEPVTFTLAGTLTLHGQTMPVTMQVGPATVIDNHLNAQATMTIDLADYGISLPAAIVDSTIALHVTLVADALAPQSPTAQPAP